MYKLIYIILIGLLASSCNSSKSTSTESDNLEENYGLVVSFYSPGNGIDRKMKNAYIDFIGSYKVKINYETIKWGKEGEVDFCIALTELSKKQKKDFVQKSKELLAESTKVHIYEGAPCRHKTGR